MLNKFVSGLIWGFGFSLSFIVVCTIWLNYLIPLSTTSDVSDMSESMTATLPNSVTIPFDDKYPFIENFSDLPLEDKISNSTAIVVTNISKNESGAYEQRITEILKKKDDVELYYKVGDLYEDHSDYNRYETEDMFIPKGFIVFMGGSTASMMYSVSYSGDRIGSLGGISMELLRQKCDS